MRNAAIELRAQAGKERAVADFLQAHAARSKMLEEDCRDFQITIGPEDAANIVTIMSYATTEAQSGPLF